MDATTVRLPAGTGFDAGGIGKGLAADLVTTEAIAAGADGICVNLGGDLRVAGTGPDGAWTVGIEKGWYEEAGLDIEWVLPPTPADSSKFPATGATQLGLAFAPDMLAAASQGLDFVSVASEAGRRGLPNEAVYCASKFAQVGFTRALEHELRPHGIRCTNVCPGGVHTDFAIGDDRGRTEGMEALAGMMSAGDVAEAVLFVASRPRNHRILEVAFRPMTEESWG